MVVVYRVDKVRDYCSKFEARRFQKKSSKSEKYYNTVKHRCELSQSVR